MEINQPIIVPAIARTASFTLDATMAGQTVVVTSSSAVTITVAAGLPLGFSCTFVQGGAGVLTFAGASGVTIRNLASQTKSGGQYSIQSILVAITDNPILAGQTAA